MRKKDGRLYLFCVFIYRMLDEFGINLLKTGRAFIGIAPFIRDTFLFAKSKGAGDIIFSKGMPYPCLGDRFSQSGSAEGVYFHQDLFVAQRIFKRNPERHIDIGSRVDGFVAHVASFREIEVMDVRELSSVSKNIFFQQADLMDELDSSLVESCDSLSCLHALEHFGLGRYGDPICRDGFLRGWENLRRILKPGGILYFSVPLGIARVEFNAHRVFSVEQLKKLIEGKYELLEFSCVDDNGTFYEDRLLDDGLADNFGCWFGCAILELRKR
jgi:SAM-dependent methyltransferase